MLSDADRCQMMGTNDISGVWRSFKKGIKVRHSKLWHHLHAATHQLRIYVDGRLSVCCVVFTAHFFLLIILTITRLKI